MINSISPGEAAQQYAPILTTDHEYTIAYIRSRQHDFLAGYNQRNEEVEALLKVMDNLPNWLRDAANVLDFKADQIGKESILSPKLNWYAEKITDILNKYNKTT
jgi:hypothetical protein